MQGSHTVRLATGALRAEVAPLVGGSLAAFWHASDDGQRTDWLRPASARALTQGDPLAMGSFPLVPFCNRLRQGRASFEGREIHCPPNQPAMGSPHPLHGIGWQRSWQITAQSPEAVELRLAVRASPAWPWSFSATQRITLSDTALTVRIAVTNEDDAAMPVGIGHHPYFPHRPRTRLTSPCAAMWLIDREVMPTTLATGEVVDRLRAGASLDELALDNNFIGWERIARIDWPAQGPTAARHLLLQAEPPLDYFVVYSPRGADYFCAEPVSQCTDWLNLLESHGRQALGGARLVPGETLSGQFSLTPAWGA